MSDLKIHDEHTAPEPARGKLAAIKHTYGDIPNMLGVLAENPAALDAYLALSNSFDHAGFDPLARHVVLIAASIENACHFCVAAQSSAAAAEGLDAGVIDAVLKNRPIADARLDALRVFTRRMVRQRGFVSDTEVTVFLNAGWTRADILGVILGVSLKTLSNYTNHVAETPLNKAYRPYAWAPCTRACAAGTA